MRSILFTTAIALAAGTAPANSFAQAWAPQKGAGRESPRSETGRVQSLVVVGTVNVVPHVGSGRMRVLGVAAPQRLPGLLANVPTWREQGVDVVHGSWRGVFGPRGLTPAQLAFWESAMRKIAETPEWKTDLERNFWSDNFLTGAPLKKEIEREHAATKAVLTDLGLAK